MCAYGASACTRTWNEFGSGCWHSLLNVSECFLASFIWIIIDLLIYCKENGDVSVCLLRIIHSSPSILIFIHSFICLFAILLCQGFSSLYDCLMEHSHSCIKLFSLDIYICKYLPFALHLCCSLKWWTWLLCLVSSYFQSSLWMLGSKVWCVFCLVSPETIFNTYLMFRTIFEWKWWGISNLLASFIKF